MIEIKYNNQILKFHTYKDKKDIPISVIEMVEKFVNELRYILLTNEIPDKYVQMKMNRLEAVEKALELDYTPQMMAQFLREIKARRYGLNTFTLPEANRIVLNIMRLQGNSLLSYLYITIGAKIQNKILTDTYTKTILSFPKDRDILLRMILRFVGYTDDKKANKKINDWFNKWKNENWEWLHEHKYIT